MTVKADPKAIAARKAAHGQTAINTEEARKENLQRKKQSVDKGKANAWRKEHGLVD